ncbi:MAG: cell division protein FtsQ/DivIB [Mariprofundus sp.]|nr:cell division protein FtsQ/DivIB [Mariprofundus sp.]
MSRNNQRRIDPKLKQQSHRRSLQRVGRTLMLLALIAISVGSGLWLNQTWSTTAWQINADAPIKAAIEAQLAAMPNKDFISMRPDHLRQQWLQAIPDLEAVRISRILPDRLHIQADARVATALWQDELGQLHLFDELGVAYRPLNNGESPDLPLLRVNRNQLPQVQRILAAMAQSHVQQFTDLSEIRARNQHWQFYFSGGVAWLIPQHNAVKVINHIQTFMQQERWRNRHWSVDARLQSRWFIRPAGHGGVI